MVKKQRKASQKATVNITVSRGRDGLEKPKKLQGSGGTKTKQSPATCPPTGKRKIKLFGQDNIHKVFQGVSVGIN